MVRGIGAQSGGDDSHKIFLGTLPLFFVPQVFENPRLRNTDHSSIKSMRSTCMLYNQIKKIANPPKSEFQTLACIIIKWGSCYNTNAEPQQE